MQMSIIQQMKLLTLQNVISLQQEQKFQWKL